MRRADESGFALLLVFLMASVVAIGLYYELPRVAMETQRQKEQLLIERGEQYKRAIQLFVRKAGRYPSEIKELENFQNQRFLRHRYRLWYHVCTTRVMRSSYRRVHGRALNTAAFSQE